MTFKPSPVTSHAVSELRHLKNSGFQLWLVNRTQKVQYALTSQMLLALKQDREIGKAAPCTTAALQHLQHLKEIPMAPSSAQRVLEEKRQEWLCIQITLHEGSHGD